MLEREAKLLFSVFESTCGLRLPKRAEVSAHLFGGEIRNPC
ncbi:MAG: hypothetical protein JWQ42_2206 [Edaphobacter sp.]|nr:hypothetical protein [Edaphobacter sp.]